MDYGLGPNSNISVHIHSSYNARVALSTTGNQRLGNKTEQKERCRERGRKKVTKEGEIIGDVRQENDGNGKGVKWDGACDEEQWLPTVSS